MTGTPSNSLSDRHRLPVAGIATAIAVAVGLLLFAPSSAAAHDGLISSSPPADSTVISELEEVSLTFSDEMLDLGDADQAFVIQVVGPDGLFYNLECVQRDGTTAKTAVALGESGQYEVTWRVVSSDGHPISDMFEFAYEKPAEAVSAAGSTFAPCSADLSDGTGDGGEAAPDETAVGVDVWVVVGWVAGAAALVVVGVALAVLAVRRRANSSREQ